MTVLPFPARAQDAFDLDVDPTDWREMAECTRTDPEAFFADDASTTEFAKRVCDDCPVRVLCLGGALQLAAEGERVWGVWGGLDERQRRKLSRSERRLILTQASIILADAA